MPNAKGDNSALKQPQIKSNEMSNELVSLLVWSCHIHDLVVKVPAV